MIFLLDPLGLRIGIFQVAGAGLEPGFSV